MNILSPSFISRGPHLLFSGLDECLFQLFVGMLFAAHEIKQMLKICRGYQL